MALKTTVAHVTHEAVGKIGGIGAVLEGMLTSDCYNAAVDRTVLISPLFSTDGPAHTRLGENGEVLYSSLDGLTNSPYARNFQNIERYYNVNIVYGRKSFTEPLTLKRASSEIILIDITRIESGPVNDLKCALYNEFGIQSHLYENLWEYEQYVRLAVPAIAALKAIGACDNQSNTIIVSHEFMGMPTALAAEIDTEHDFKTVFYAHEVATARRIVEHHHGHDTMFYNVMKKAREKNLYAGDVFGDQHDFFKHALVEAAKFCDNILAVGDYVVDELKFLAPGFQNVDIDLTYNGIPSFEISLNDKKESKAKLQTYCNNLLGYIPDYVFTHVTRLVPSKGLWRDIRVLEHMEKEFRAQDKTAVLFLLSTEVGQRRRCDIEQMENEYNWPVAHREGMPDMSGGETNFFLGVQDFNARSRNIKIVYINQFGFDHKTCGNRMPEEMEFMDIRIGSDCEFGQSIYEPFGIAQLEPLSFGGLCVVTNVCGCAGFVNDVTKGEPVKNVIVADYTELNGYASDDIDQLKQIGLDIRDKIEHRISGMIALEICARLPKTDQEIQSLVSKGYELAKQMSWEAVVEKYVMRSFYKAMEKSHAGRGQNRLIA